SKTELLGTAAKVANPIISDDAKALPTVEPQVCFSIKSFCIAHHLSREMFHKMQRMGIGPQVMRIGRRVLVSSESAARWRAEREQEFRRLVPNDRIRRR